MGANVRAVALDEALALILCGAGIIAFLRVRSKRRGSTPHCPRCDYILTGNDSATCPECGNAFTPATIVSGDRARRNGIASLCVMLVVIGWVFGGKVAFNAINQVNWYHYRPFTWLMSDLDVSTPGIAEKSWDELKRRVNEKLLTVAQRSQWSDRVISDFTGANAARQYRAWVLLQPMVDSGDLSEGQWDTLIDYGLRHQPAAMPHFIDAEGWVLKLIGQRCIANMLRPVQRSRLFSGCTVLKLKTRERVGLHDRIPYEVEDIGKGPYGWIWNVDDIAVLVDDKLTTNGSGTSITPPMSRIASNVPEQSIGKHQLHVTLRIAVGTSDHSQREMQAVLYREKRTLSVPFEVLKDELPIKFVDTLDAATVGGCIRASGFLLWNSGNRDLTGTIAIREPPVNLAFDAFARVNRTEYPLGVVSAAKGEWRWFELSCHPPVTPFATVDIILRSSETAAKSTVDLDEIWKGELLLKGVGGRESVFDGRSRYFIIPSDEGFYSR